MKIGIPKRMLALLLVLCMVIPMLPVLTPTITVQAASASDPVIVIAGSDFQDTNAGTTVSTILSNIKGAVSGTPAGFLFCGDYSNSTSVSASTSGVSTLKNAVNSVYDGLADSDSAVYIQGNHDPEGCITNGVISASGSRDTADYGVYVINEDDFMWHTNGTEADAKQTASELSSYLEEKLNGGYGKPIFVMSHIPLHYTMRTSAYGDGRYANYVFDVLNAAGGMGLNIIFLFGHHHSNSWLDSQGGSAVYFEKGDKINIPQVSQSYFKEETLNFTYMNAGYVGYYSTTNSTEGVEKDLTMSVFEISGTDVKISRYGLEGKHDLKSAGVANTAWKEPFEVNTKVVSSPATVKLSKLAAANGITVSTDGITGLKTTAIAPDVPAGYSAYRSYDINPTGYTKGASATVSIPVDSTFDRSRPALVIDHTNGRVYQCPIMLNRVSFVTDHFSDFSVAQADIDAFTASQTVTVLKRAKSVSDLKEGVPYIISDYKESWYHYMLTNKASTVSGRKGLLLDGVPTPESQHLWYIRDGKIVYGAADSDQYLLIAATADGVHLGAYDETYAAYAEAYSGDDLAIRSSGSFLNRYGGATNSVVATYYSAAGGSYWHFDAVMDQELVINAVPGMTSLTTSNTTGIITSVTLDGEEIREYAITWSSADDRIATVDGNGFVQAITPGRTSITATVTAVNGITLAAPVSVEIPLNVYYTTKGEPPVTATATRYAMSMTTELVPGTPSGPYVISSALDTEYLYLSGNLATSALPRQGLELLKTNNYEHLWYYDGAHLRYNAPDGPYLVYTQGTVKLGTDVNTAFDTVTYNGGSVYLIQNSHITGGSSYLNQCGGEKYNTVATYGNGNWIFNKIDPAAEVNLAVTPGISKVTVGGTQKLNYSVICNGAKDANGYVSWISADPSVATVQYGTVTGVKAGTTTITCTLTRLYGDTNVGQFSVTIPVEVTAQAQTEDCVSAIGYAESSITKITNVTSGVPSGPYVITNRSTGRILSGNEGYTSSKCTGLELVAENDYQHLWYYDGKYLRYGAPNGQYLAVENGQVCLSRSESAAFDGVELYANADGSLSTGYLIRNSKVSGNQYLNQLGGGTNYAAGLWAGDGTSRWYIYDAKAEPTVTLQVYPDTISGNVGQNITLKSLAAMNGVYTSEYTIDWASSDTSVATVSNGVVTTHKFGRVIITATLTKVNGLGTNLVVQIPVSVQNIEQSADNVLTLSTVLGPRSSRVTSLSATEISGPYQVLNTASGDILAGVENASSPLATGLWIKPFVAGDYTDLWYYDGTYLIYGDPNATDRYMVFDNGLVGIGSDRNVAFDCVTAITGTYKNSFEITGSFITDSRKYLNQYGSDAYEAAALHAEGGTTGGSAWGFYKIESESDVVFSVYPDDHSLELQIDNTKKLIPSLKLNSSNYTKYTVTYTSSDPSVALVGSDGTVYPKKSGTVTIDARLETLDEVGVGTEVVIPVTIRVADVASVTINTKEGSVPVNASDRLKVHPICEGAEAPVLTVTYDTGTQKQLPLIAEYLTDASGKNINTSEAGAHTPLTVAYQGVVACTDFTLHVLASELPDYPDYPAEGSVFVNKTASDTQNFQSSGIAQVELSTSGVPVKKGADVIIMLDTSSSMGGAVEGASDVRLNVLCDSLNDLINGFQTKAADGTTMDIRVAVADFNGFYHDVYSPYYIDPNDTMSNSSIRSGTDSRAVIYTGDKTLSAGAFIKATDFGMNPFTTNKNYQGPTSKKYTLTMASGTNYDYALDAVYQMGEAINDANANAEEDRDLFVIFMSDGAPFQYNYFGSQSKTTYWSNFLMGTMTDDMFDENSNRAYYREDGKHWMAEAIKGERRNEYPVIRKNDYRDLDGDNFINVKGLGATMYSIGFCLYKDNEITEESMNFVIDQIATSSDYSFKVKTAEGLAAAFNKISNDIMYAASDAYFVDTMGEEYDLKLGNHSYQLNGVPTTFTDNRIEYRIYDIYTQADFENGDCTEAQIGVRKKDSSGNCIYSVVETVTFNAAGTEAYSDLIYQTADDGTKTYTNILINGVICAQSFWYNTTAQAVSVDFDKDGKIERIDNNKDGVYDYDEMLKAETFHWKVGTISTAEKALNYYVYLTDTMEGNRLAGTYPTNESAILYYENYLRNDCQLVAPIPRMPWNQAQVSYGFYLVDKNGKPIVNKDTGMTGSFEMSVQNIPVWDVQYREFATGNTVSIKASRVFPGELADQYRLFDPEARYDVSLNNDGYGTIAVYTNGIVPLTTYITGLTNDSLLDGDVEGTVKPASNYATANTTVWFAVTVADDALVVDKTVDTVEGKDDEFILTLEAFASSATSPVSASFSDSGIRKSDPYALSTAQSVDPEAVFEEVMTSASEPMVQPDSNAVLRDVLSEYFQLVGNDQAKVEVYTAPFNADGTTGEPVPLEGAQITFDKTDKTSDRYDIINVTGYDYRTEYYSLYPRTRNGADYYGSKLIVKIPVETRDGFWGGNNVPTNDPDTAIYTNDDEPLVHFPEPQVNVPVKPIVSGQDQTVYYGEDKVDMLEDLVDKIIVDGKEVTYDKTTGTFTPADDWMDDCAQMSWNEELQNPADPDTNVSGTESAEYTFGVILKPKTEGTNNDNPDNPGNIAGKPVDPEGFASEPATGYVDVLVPVISFRDSTISLGDKTDKDYYESTNRQQTIQWVNRDDPYGTGGLPTTPSDQFNTAPALTFTYTPETNGEEFITEGTPVNVQVYLGTTPTDDNKITDEVYFGWIECGSDLHREDETVTDDVTTDDLHRHKGDVASNEFYVHLTYVLSEDVIVIDFGLSVDVAALMNDNLPGDAVVTAVGKADAIPALFTETLADGYGSSQTSDYGTMALNADKTTLRYTPTQIGMNGKDVFVYAVKNLDTDRYYYSTVTVIPATVIYYEDSFLSYSVSTSNGDGTYTTVQNAWQDIVNSTTNGGWELAGTITDSLQAEDRPSEALDCLDANNIYGYDAAYTDMTTYSNGSAVKVTVDSSKYANATFQFWGTAFDVISMTSCNTGTIMVEVLDLETGEKNYHMVDTYYGYRYNAEAGKWEVDRTDSDALYQVPVIKVDTGKYSHYRVSINASWDLLVDHGQNGGNASYDFYLDAIRIYNPAMQKEDGSIADSVIDGAYNADNEANPTYQELRDLLIDVNSFDALQDEEIAAGVIFIDGNAQLSEGNSYASVESEGKSYAVSEYINYGPNNELYLAPGQAVTFNLDAVGIGGRVHLAVKSVGAFGGKNDGIGDGAGSATVEIFGLEGETRTDVTVGDEGVIRTATDLYYDITALAGKTVVIRNSGDAGIVSITNLKTTNCAQRRMMSIRRSDVLNVLAFLNEGDPAPIEPTGGTISLSYATLSFEDEIKMNVLFTVEDLEPVELGLITFSSDASEGTVTNAEAVIPGGTLRDGGIYSVSTRGIAAKKLGDMIYFRVYARLADGSYVYSKAAQYSPVAYANIILSGSYSSEMKALVVSMLNYGAAAQTFFGHHTDALVNKELTAQQQALVGDYSADLMDKVVAPTADQLGSFAATSAGFLRKYPTISFEGAFSINYYFTLDRAVDTAPVLYYWTGQARENADVLTAQNASGVLTMTGDEIWQAAVTGIAAKDLDDTIWVAAVYEQDGVRYCSGVLSYSIGAYCVTQAAAQGSAMAPFAQAAAVYGSCAKAYFG